MKYVLGLFLLSLISAGIAEAQVKVVVPSKANGPIGVGFIQGGNCYALAVYGSSTGYASHDPIPGPVTQADTTGLTTGYGQVDHSKDCVEYFYSKDQTDQLFKDQDADYQKKLNEVKSDYVDKISSLSPEVLAAIKDEVKQQLMAELVPQIRDEIKKQLQQQSSGKGSTSAPKTKPKDPQPSLQSDPKPARSQN